MRSTSPNVALFGASPGTGNLGVDALCWSTLSGLAEQHLDDVTVFGHGLSARKQHLPGQPLAKPYRLLRTRVGRRIWHRDHVSRIELESRAGIRGNPVVEAVRRASVVLDVSGGDSFTDLYGNARFRAIALPKRLALRLDRPLVLLPQTYGPFQSASTRKEARRLVSQASLAYARDPDSFANLQALLEEEFDPDRHREGVDLAFGLQPHAAEFTRTTMDLSHSTEKPLIGINVSGLLANRPTESSERFGIACDYLNLIEQLVLKLLATSRARILLIPHVFGPVGHYEADQDACRAILKRFRGTLGDMEPRVDMLTGEPTACELKWIISQMDWFCGTRMHSTIAALSSGVPSAALAYSLKTRGVFARAGQADAVIDLRNTTVGDALDRLLTLWHERRKYAHALANALPGIRVAAANQLCDISALAFQQWDRRA